MKYALIFLLIAFCTAGCSKDKIIATYYVTKAEDLYQKAYEMRVKPGNEEKRKEIYRKAQQYFLKAYQADRNVFTLNRIEQAHDVCLRLEDNVNADIFAQFAQEYSEQHPSEAEYGDAPTAFLGPIE